MSNDLHIPPIKPPIIGATAVEGSGDLIKEDESIHEAEKKRKISQIENLQAIGRHACKVMIGVLWLIGLTLFVFFWHQAGPDSLLFVSEDRFAKLKEFLLSGSVGAVIGSALTTFIRAELFQEPKQKD